MSQRFVILEHDHPFLHWDLLLEAGHSLRTWRLLTIPETKVRIPAEPLPDHRVMYLDYEGEVSGNRGTVKRLHSGYLALLSHNPGGEARYEVQSCPLGTLAIFHQNPGGSPEWWFE